MNLSEAAAELGERGFQYLPPSRRYIMLNRALADFEDVWPWPWLRKTATGVTPLAISDLKYVLSVRGSDGVLMDAIDPLDIRDIDTTGTPSNWWIDDTGGTPTLKADPVGTATLTVRYVGDSTELASGTDTPSIPSRYHGIWIDLAVAYAYEDSDNFAAAQGIRAAAMARLTNLIERYETRNRSGSAQMAELSYNEDD